MEGIRLQKAEQSLQLRSSLTGNGQSHWNPNTNESHERWPSYQFGHRGKEQSANVAGPRDQGLGRYSLIFVYPKKVQTQERVHVVVLGTFGSTMCCIERHDERPSNLRRATRSLGTWQMGRTQVLQGPTGRNHHQNWKAETKRGCRASKDNEVST